MGSETVSLNGTWRFQLDPHGQLSGERTAPEALEASIRVPGSWEEQGFGTVPEREPIGTWKKKREYEGIAWYGRTVDMPAHWSGRRVRLILSGVHWRTALWLNGRPMGERESLVTDHVYDLGKVPEGGARWELLIRVDNRMALGLEESHIHSGHTATNWGGITGGAVLVAHPPCHLDGVKIWPDAPSRRVELEVSLAGMEPGTEGTWRVEAAVEAPGADGGAGGVAETGRAIAEEAGGTGTAPPGAPRLAGGRDSGAGPWTASASPDRSGRVSLALELGPDAALWSDRNPFLYRLKLALFRDGDPAPVDETFRTFGLRSFRAEGRKLTLNGKPVFLRGYVDCCVFPLTGYPVWDEEAYRRQFRIAKSYGFNHVRLHGWTAPKPFWRAADAEGMLVQAELPNWSLHYRNRSKPADAEAHAFLVRELRAVLDALNEHPSFVMLSLGNELIGRDGHEQLNELVRTARCLDPTRLYTDNTGFGDLPAHGREGDYFVPTLNWHPPFHIDQAASPDATQDFGAVTRLEDRPLIAHEHGQFTMYVRPQEKSKYTGVLEPAWLDYIEENLRHKGWEHRLETFQAATGTMLVRNLKEAMEKARRTPDLAGIQLLDIRDFPGQGHATVGLLDVFWDDKGVVSPAQVRAFNGESVLLMRCPRRTFFAGETWTVELELSHYGDAVPDGARLSWEWTDQDQVLDSGSLTAGPLAPGALYKLASPSFSSPGGKARKVRLRARLEENGQIICENEWDFWTFPKPVPHPRSPRVETNMEAVRAFLPGAAFRRKIGIEWLSYRMDPETKLIIADGLTKEMVQYLRDGGTVWLMPKRENVQDTVDIRHLPIFWNYLWFPGQRGTTMGLLIHDHPCLGGFPHDGVSDWQWHALTEHAFAVSLDAMPNVQPIVEVIDNFARMKRLAVMFECRVGKGRLFVSSLRMTDTAVIRQPETMYLFHAVADYLLSGQFRPAAQISVAELLAQFRICAVSYDDV